MFTYNHTLWGSIFFRAFALLMLCLFTASPSASQIIELIDEGNTETIPFVNIYNTDLTNNTVSDIDGKFRLDLFDKNDTLYFSHISYQEFSIAYTDVTSQIILAPKAMDITGVVIAATRWAQNSNSTSTRISKIDSKEIALKNPQTAADMLGMSGEVFIQKSQQGGGSPIIRGFSANRLLYTVDGVRMNNAIFRSGNLHNVISLDPLAMGSTEVLFGSSSVIYGSDAIGGVMSFQTIDPKLTVSGIDFSGKALVRYSTSNQEKTGHVDFSIGGRKLGSTSSISYSDYSNLKMGSNGPDEYLNKQYISRINGMDSVVSSTDPLVQIPTAYKQINLMQKLKYRPLPYLTFNYGFHYSQSGNFGRYDRHLRERNGNPRYAEWNYGPQSWMMNALEVEYDNKNALFDRMKLIFANQLFEESRITRNFRSDERYLRTENINALSLNLDFLKTLNPKQLIFYGAEWVTNEVESKGEIENILTSTKTEAASRYPQANWNSLGVYLSHQWKIRPKIHISSGFRYSYFKVKTEFNQEYYPINISSSELDHSALTGSLGINYIRNNKDKYYINLSSGFRAPNVDDIGKVFDSEPGAVVVPNTNLKSEYSLNAEVGGKWKINKAINVDGAVYYTQLLDALVRRDYVLDGLDSIVYDGVLSKVQAIQNASQAYVYGVQLGVKINIIKNTSFITQVNWQKGKERQEDGTYSPSRHAPPSYGLVGLKYNNDKLSLEINSRFQDQVLFKDLAKSEQNKEEIYAIDDQGQPFSPAWWTLNLKSSYSINSFLSVQVGVENLLNKRYRTYSSGIAAAGRNLSLSLTLDMN